MFTENIKKLAIQVMIGSLIGAATIAVISVLTGEFNDTLSKALFTLGLVTLHALASLAYIDNTKKKYGEGLKFFSNTIFLILILSFFTSVFGVWELFDGELVARLYGTYMVFGFASLHGELLFSTIGKKDLIDYLVYANYVFMGLVVVLLLPVIWADASYLGDFYYRLLAAAGIIDATLTVLAILNHKIYLQKHPEENSALFSYVETTDENGNVVRVKAENSKRRIHPLLFLLGLYLVLQFVVGIVGAIIGNIR